MTINPSHPDQQLRRSRRREVLALAATLGFFMAVAWAAGARHWFLFGLFSLEAAIFVRMAVLGHHATGKLRVLAAGLLTAVGMALTAVWFLLGERSHSGVLLVIAFVVMVPGILGWLWKR